MRMSGMVIHEPRARSLVSALDWWILLKAPPQWAYIAHWELLHSHGSQNSASFPIEWRTKFEDIQRKRVLIQQKPKDIKECMKFQKQAFNAPTSFVPKVEAMQPTSKQGPQECNNHCQFKFRKPQTSFGQMLLARSQFASRYQQHVTSLECTTRSKDPISTPV